MFGRCMTEHTAFALNNSIKVLDRLEVPGPDEILECVAVSQEAHEAVFGDLSRHFLGAPFGAHSEI